MRVRFYCLVGDSAAVGGEVQSAQALFVVDLRQQVCVCVCVCVWEREIKAKLRIYVV